MLWASKAILDSTQNSLQIHINFQITKEVVIDRSAAF